MRIRIPITELSRVSTEALLKCAVPVGDAAIVTDSIVDCHLRGKGTHGIGRLPIYVRKIQAGLMAPDTRITFVKDAPVVTVIDANHGFGQVAGVRAMQLCIEKAEKFGLGVVGVRNSNNFGAAGFLARIPVQRGMIGLVLGNSAPAIAPTGGSKPLLGTNPLCLAFPASSGGASIVLDMASSTAARGKIRLAAKSGDRIPFGWALDADGKPTDDPIEALKGTMLPIGGHKGYGLALAIDILAGLLSGAAYGGDVKPLNSEDGFSNYGHLFAALRIDQFMEMEEYQTKMDFLIERLKASGEEGAVFYPGEMSEAKARESVEFVDLPRRVVDEVRDLAVVLGVSPAMQSAD